MTLSVQLIQDLAVILLSATLAGWICGKLNISKVVGYLVVGIIIGTPQITVVYVTDAQRIQTLSQLGLVFLMFFVGLQFRIGKIRELGVGPVVATAVTAIITLTITRMAAAALGYSEGESLFLAGMLVVSSSAIISRVLEEYKLNHDRAGQLAMGVTLLEDMVAIVMLAWLGSYSAAESLDATASPWPPLVKTIGLLFAFAAIVIVPGLFLIPKGLTKICRAGGAELETLLVAGLMFFMAYLTVATGFSLALGAFLCGVIVSESANSRVITANFSGLKDVFVTVFFTAIGMSIDIFRFPEAMPLILLGVALAMVVRVVASSIGFLVAAETEKTALRAGLCLTPIGEFSFVIAGLGISAGILDGDFQIAAVGISFLTSLLSPLLIKQSDKIARALSPSRIKSLEKTLRFYREMWSGFERHRSKNPMARILTPRLWQIGREILLATALLVFARPGYEATAIWIQNNHPALGSFAALYWLAIFVACLLPIVAFVRNVNAITLIVSEHFIGPQARRSKLRLSFTYLLRLLAFAVTTIWLSNFIPIDWIDRYALIGLLVASLLGAVFGWRILIRWYSHVEVALSESARLEPDLHPSSASLRESSQAWKLDLVEFTIPEGSSYAGKTIATTQLRTRSNASIVGVERQGHQLTTIGPGTHLFPGDLLFLVGDSEALKKAQDLLSTTRAKHAPPPRLSLAILDQITVPEKSPWVGATLETLQWPKRYGVQIVAIQRGEVPRLSPDPSWQLQAGDNLLLAGPQSAIKAMKSE
ncbi:cation:proton antiporter [Pelagicoccus sp. SDUM812005]|uniref:cation:proton antiporter n=1 Tax=Pelagicoccus sp. SDUM812005 TaxID=3041257 RepID=UPI00280C5D9B|nr:cation:proton antiporter [Pelagicoccus sp. SDUM812005]MDQ8182234.1 cation:proton antiporter [Pelagicoccus sp. SDUM812005]